MINFKFNTYEIENYQHPYAVKFHFSHMQKEIDDLHYLLEHEMKFRRVGSEFHFNTEEERQRFVARLEKRYE